MNFFARFSFFLVVLILSFVLSGCGCNQQVSSAGEPDGSIQIVDINGRTVRLKAEPRKIAVLPIPWASMIYAINGDSNCIAAVHPDAMTAYKGHLHECMDKNFGSINHSLIGKNFELNAEGAAKAEIDVVVLWKYQTKEAEQLSRIGIPAIMIDNADMNSLHQSITIIGSLLGKPERAEKLNAYYDAAYRKVLAHKEKVEQADFRPRVLFLRNKKLRLQGTDNFIHEIIEMSGGLMPVEQSANSNVEITISLEEIYRLNPDIILLSNFDSFEPADFYKNKIAGQDWQQVNAVRNHRVYKVPMGLYRWDAPGAETPLMIEWLAHLIQPAIFHDVDVIGDTKLFYKDFLHYELTQKDYDLIFRRMENQQSEVLFP